MDANQLKSIAKFAEENFETGDTRDKLLSAQVLLQIELLRGMNSISKQIGPMKAEFSEGIGDLIDSIENRLWPLVVEWDVQEEAERDKRSEEAEKARKKSPFSEEQKDE